MRGRKRTGPCHRTGAAGAIHPSQGTAQRANKDRLFSRPGSKRPRPSSPSKWSASTLRAYAEHADAYLVDWDGKRYRIPPLLLESIGLLPKRARVLDLGCGPGQDSRYLRRRGFRAFGLDGTWPFLLRARKRSGRLPLVQADFGSLPFRRRAFTFVWAAASLIHMPKREVRRLLRVLKTLVEKNGCLAATFAHGKGSGYLRTGWIPGRYVSLWRKGELARSVTGAGWTIVSLITVSNRERKGRWLNLIARRDGKGL
jgi:SAM-dependent methyltransferase